MAALTAKRDVRRQPGQVIPVPVAAATKILEGALVMALSGYAVNGADTATGQILGYADKTVDNTAGGAGAVNVLVRTGGVIDLATSFSAAQTDLGAQVYIADNQTVGKTTTNSVKCGKVVAFVSSAKVRVLVQTLI